MEELYGSMFVIFQTFFAICRLLLVPSRVIHYSVVLQIDYARFLTLISDFCPPLKLATSFPSSASSLSPLNAQCLPVKTLITWGGTSPYLTFRNGGTQLTVMHGFWLITRCEQNVVDCVNFTVIFVIGHSSKQERRLFRCSVFIFSVDP